MLQIPGNNNGSYLFLGSVLLLPESCPEFNLYGLDDSSCMNCYHCVSVRVNSGLGLLGMVNHHSVTDPMFNQDYFDMCHSLCYCGTYCMLASMVQFYTTYFIRSCLLA